MPKTRSLKKWKKLAAQGRVKYLDARVIKLIDAGEKVVTLVFQHRVPLLMKMDGTVLAFSPEKVSVLPKPKKKSKAEKALEMLAEFGGQSICLRPFHYEWGVTWHCYEVMDGGSDVGQGFDCPLKAVKAARKKLNA